jgi:hypothetical protein
LIGLGAASFVGSSEYLAMVIREGFIIKKGPIFVQTQQLS